MSDNVGYTPGSGEVIASDDIGGVQHQRIKVVIGPDGVNDGDVSDANPMPVKVLGELIEAVEAMRMAVQALTRTVGLAQVNPLTGSMFVDGSRVTQPVSGTVSVGTPAVAQSGTWNITNIATIGGQAANSQVPSFERMTADNLRRNINVT